LEKFALPLAAAEMPRDFRSVYGTLLSDWLKAPDIIPILGASYPKLGVIG